MIFQAVCLYEITSGGFDMETIMIFTQFFFTVVIGLYFLTRLKGSAAKTGISDDAKKEAERLNMMRHISLSEPLTERARPSDLTEIIGQDEGVRALKAALCGKNPQHVLIYGPPGVGKTAAARVALEAAKVSDGTPFRRDARFVEADATIMRFDERCFADPLIGSVHDPIYQGAGEFGSQGIPQPKMGAVSKAHGGVLFIDEIGELHPTQINKLLKVLEDRKVMLESAYYSSGNKNIPMYIHDIFQNGIPADFRLIGATTRRPDEIPPAVRSRCVEIFFNRLSRKDIEKIILNAAGKFGIIPERKIISIISQYAQNGRDAIKILQTLSNITALEGRNTVTAEDAEWVIKAGRYKCAANDGKIIDISFIKPQGNV